MRPLTLIGRAEKVELPQLSTIKVPAKIDTGADASSIWAHKIENDGDNLNVTFFGHGSAYYNGQVHTFLPNQYTITRVSNSFGHREIRYKVKLKICVKGRLINGTFTLADRSTKLYPILLGRSLIKHKFLVDVTKGGPLVAEEKARKAALREEIINIRGKV
ncbi:MAG TPA: RimK/LysX family protein [Candidatus Angelobacter sp.]|nr:RimK/LysX family protein [Candidatus Angelobacter sp.]